MNKMSLLLFVVVIIFACTFATVVKIKNVNYERQWKDYMMNAQLEAVQDSEVKYAEVKSMIVQVQGRPETMTEARVKELVNVGTLGLFEQLRLSLLKDLNVYSPTAYCVTEESDEHIRLDCKKFE